MAPATLALVDNSASGLPSAPQTKSERLNAQPLVDRRVTISTTDMSRSMSDSLKVPLLLSARAVSGIEMLPRTHDYLRPIVSPDSRDPSEPGHGARKKPLRLGS